MTSDIPGPRTPDTNDFAHYVVHDGTVTGYAPGVFVDVRSGDGRTGRYALDAATRVDTARMRSASASLQVGLSVNLTARLDGGAARATVIRLGAGVVAVSV